MDITFHDVGVCEGCPAFTDAPAAFSLTFSKIGLCAGCQHTGQKQVCGGCERDVDLLARRDLHGHGGCSSCQRSLLILQRRDLFQKGLPTKIQERLAKDDPGREVEERNRKAIQSWVGGG